MMANACYYGLMWYWCQVTPGAPDGERFARAGWRAAAPIISLGLVPMTAVSSTGCRLDDNSSGWILFAVMALWIVAGFWTRRSTP